jgi:hypothetical protein
VPLGGVGCLQLWGVALFLANDLIEGKVSSFDVQWFQFEISV